MIRSILGPNAYMAKQRLSQLLAELESNSIERFEGVDIDVKELAGSLRAQSLFTNPTVVVSNISEQKSLHDSFMELVESLGDDIELIIYEPTIDKRSRYYKFLLKQTDCDEFKVLDANQLAAWLVDVAKEREGQIERNVAWHLVERVGEDQWQLSNELDKLLLYGQPITKELIDEAVEPTPNESIFKLLDAVAASNPKQVLEIYDRLIAQKIDPQYIISMLVWQLNILAIVVFAGTRSPDVIAKEAGLSPFVVKKTANVAKNISKNQIKNMLEAAAELDASLKSITIDAEEALKQLLIKLSS